MTRANRSVPHAENGSGKGILLGIIAAIVLGTALGGWAPDWGQKTYLVGEVFLRALKMIVVPLVMFSMVVGITSLGDVRHLGAIGWRTALFFGVTTGIAVLIGLILVLIFRPGSRLSAGEKHPSVSYTIDADGRTVRVPDGTWERARFEQYAGKHVLVLTDQRVRGDIAAVSPNSVTVKFWESLSPEGVLTITSDDGSKLSLRRENGQLVSAEPQIAPSGVGLELALPVAGRLKGKEGRNVANTLSDVFIGMIPENVFESMAKTEALPLIVFSLLFGAALAALGERGRPAIEVIASLNDGIMRLVMWIMYAAPVGIFGLVAGRIGLAGGFHGFLPELLAVGRYSAIVVFGLFLHGAVALPLILWLVGRRNPISFTRGMIPALLNAFSTASSNATIPLTMDGLERGNGVSNRTASFVVPLGATINMNGTALYEAVAAMFVAQVYGIELSLAQTVVVFLTATLAAIGAAGIPEAGLVTMVIVLKAVGLPIEGIALILTVDWLLDRFRTTVNVWGDAVGAGVIETYENRAASRT